MVQDLTIKQGKTYAATVEYRTAAGAVVSLAGYSARMQLRRALADDDETVIFELDANELIVQEAEGNVLVLIPPARTEIIPYGRFVYDLEVFTANDADVIELLRGGVNVFGEVTRAA